MNRKKLLKELNKLGCVFIRHGGNHDWYKNPVTGVFKQYQDTMKYMNF